tara:strand:- start:107 stop:319 length:213 start_codon:yes stop_codon:yes gene_type:complete
MKERLQSRVLWLSIIGSALGPVLKAVSPDLPWEVILMSVLSALGGAGFIARRDIETIRTSAFKKDDEGGK